MQRLKRSASLITLIITVLLLAAPVDAQQKRPATPKKPPATEPAEPAPTFDSLLGADSYRVYSEIRNVGQLVRSPSVNDLLDPLMKLASPPREFKAVIKWINAHAEPLASSRMLVASWPTRPNLPFVLIAVEFSSADEARKFESELRGFMPTLMPTPTASPGALSGSEAKVAQPNSTSDDSAAVLPTYQIKQSGTLVLLTDKPLSFRDLKPRGSGLLAESPNFALARNRFASESLFLYVDLKSIEKEQREQRQKWEQEEQKRRESEAANPPKEDLPDVGMEPKIASDQALTEPPVDVVIETRQATLQATPADPQVSGTATLSARPVQGREPMEAAMFPIYAALFGGQTKWPEAVGVAIAFDDDGYVVRALIANAPENKSTAIPFVPQFVSGPALTPASPNVLPADTNLFVSVSVDYAQVYEGMVKTLASAEELSRRYNRLPASNAPPTSPFAAYEKKLGLSVKDDLLPLLGNEIALALPKQASGPGLSNASAEEMTTPPGVGQKSPAAQGLTPIIAISVKDKEGVKRLIPKVIESLAFKGANLLAQTEKRDETEITSYANVLSYAFIGDFLMISPDPAVTRQVVDSYLNHRTLSSDGHFRNSTRWQPRQLLGQVYVAPSLIDLYFPLGGGGSAQANDKMRDFLSRMNPVIEPLSYALSNEGLGPLHEVHIPKSLLMVMIAGMTSKASEMPLVTNESVARSILRTVVSAEATFHATKGDGRYGTLEELISEGLLSKDLIERYGYKIDLSILSNKFEATAVPLEYGKTGRLSFFVDESGVLRGGDHGGGAATLSDKPVEQ